MNCTDCFDNLTAYLDAEVSPEFRAEMDSHLSACGVCRSEEAGLRESMDYVDARVREIDLRPQLWDGVWSRIAQLDAPVDRRSFWSYFGGRRGAMAAAAVALSFLLAIGGWQYVQEQRSRAALMEYMTQYVERRIAEERAHDAGGGAVYDNPFLTPREGPSFGNPFLEETR